MFWRRKDMMIVQVRDLDMELSGLNGSQPPHPKPQLDLKPESFDPTLAAS